MKIKSIFVKEFERDTKTLNADGTVKFEKFIYKKYLLGKEEIYLYNQDGKLLKYRLLKDNYINRFIDFIEKKIEEFLDEEYNGYYHR